jgi:hypothetical protein
MSVKIQIDEIEAEMDYKGWINFKSKIMAAMLNGTVSWDEGNAMRNLIDHALTQASAKAAKEEYLENFMKELNEDRSIKNSKEIN